MSKVRLPAILLNADFYSKPRNRRWIKAEGEGAVIALQMIWIALSQEKDNRLSLHDISAIPFITPIDDKVLPGFLNSCVEIGLLEFEDGFYFNSQIVSDSKKFKAKHNNYSAAAKNRELAKQEQNPGKIVAGFRQNHIDIDIDNDPDLNKIEIALHEFRTPRVEGAVYRWAQHRRKLGKSFDQMAADALLNLYAGRPQDLADDIDHSISNGWRTLNAKNNAILKQPKKSQREILNEMMEAENATE